MYFYIFDIKKCRKKSQVEDIKNYLSMLGISGEFTYPTAALTCEELVDLGLNKKYSTIIAIGGDEIANQIAGKLCGRPEVMGVVPLEATEHLTNLIGTNDWREACDNLRFRKISEIHIGKTGNGKTFLTNAILDLSNPMELTIEFKDFIISGLFKNLIISNFHNQINKRAPNYLDIVAESEEIEHNGFLSMFSGLFKTKSSSQKSLSLFHARSLRIFAKKSITIKAGEESITKTPEYIESTDQKVRIITAKKLFEDEPDSQSQKQGDS